MNKSKTILVRILECKVCGMHIWRCDYCCDRFERNQTIYCDHELKHYCKDGKKKLERRLRSDRYKKISKKLC